MNVESMWATGHGIHSFTSRTGLDSLVTAEHLGPGFLENQRPDLIDTIVAARSAESPPVRIGVVGEVVIDDDSALLTIHIELQSVEASLVHFMVQEDALDTVRRFCER